MVKRFVIPLIFLIALDYSYLEGSIGDRIVFYAKKFIGVPYDPDPMGAYVREKKIIYDWEVDCMYLVFRSVELAFAEGDDEKSVKVALDKRFRTTGILKDGYVINYEDRFEYGEDMFLSGKWGKVLEVNRNFIKEVYSSRLNMNIKYVPKRAYSKVRDLIKNGDIVFFVKDPSKSVKGEVVGHLGILEVSNDIYLIHAKGKKGRGGKVVRERFKDYLDKTQYLGFVVSRFE